MSKKESALIWKDNNADGEYKWMITISLDTFLDILKTSQTKLMETKVK